MTKILNMLIAIFAVSVLIVFLFIIMFYTTQLSLSLVGPDKIKTGLYSVYEDPGAEAVVNGKDYSDKVKVKGKVDTSVPGTYVITYKAGTLVLKREVMVMDEMNPKIDLTPLPEGYEMSLGDTYSEPGYIATDEKGNDITEKVSVEGSEIIRAGENTVKYTVSDDEGNTTIVTRSVYVEPNTDYDAAGLGICMYHYVYDEKDPPADLHQRYGNYISMQDLEEELNWLNEEGYYYPKWEEVRAYVDGELLLPDKSVVLCFDDGAMSFLQYGIPVLEKCKVPATCFMITSSSGAEKISTYKSDYVYYESHSHNMHRGGGSIGHGGILTSISYEDGMQDLKTSIEICASSDAFAYPFGDYNERSRDMIEDAGFLCAVTTQYGKAYPGDDAMLLPRLRMSMGQSLASFKSMVSPR